MTIAVRSLLCVSIFHSNLSPALIPKNSVIPSGTVVLTELVPTLATPTVSLIPYSFIVPTIYKYTVLTVEEVNYQYTYVYITVDMTATINPRELKGKVIAGKYKVILTKIGWTFSCPDHKFRGVKCRHIYAVEISYAIRRQVEVTRIEPLVNIHECIYCKSITIVKDGLRRNKSGDIQKFNCKSCHRYFTINIGFEKMKHNPQGVTTAMQLYFSGESLRNTSRSLKLIGMDVTH